MIAKLKGLIDTIGEDHVIVDVGGVGYLVFCSVRTLRNLPPAGEAAELHIETHVREDHIHLYGFADAIEREWFDILTGVQGVGAKVALGIQSVLSANDLAGAISARENKLLTQANGVGPKLAARIVNELKDKVGGLGMSDDGKTIASGASGTAPEGPAADAISALINLGYRPAEAMRAVTAAAQLCDGEAEVADLIKIGLRELSQ